MPTEVQYMASLLVEQRTHFLDNPRDKAFWLNDDSEAINGNNAKTRRFTRIRSNAARSSK
ncbi:hypothetical protein RR46_05637 [Papilio xuthus]|uniref:Uncharacterized protein n=1 Tax=Papilio xuthus TaxID=66420 RepID=A0A194Q0T9_PAPXU|nr:hypothetical protein RR46_05637 [Papilio xuthus]